VGESVGGAAGFDDLPAVTTYTVDDTGTPRVDITVNFVGSDNRTYDHRCRVITDALNDVGKLYKGGIAKGNTCVVNPGSADGLRSASTGFIGKPVFFAAK
jgi:hypothetical protein